MDIIVIPDCIGCKVMRVGWISYFWWYKDTHFAWLEALTILVNNTTIFI